MRLDHNSLYAHQRVQGPDETTVCRIFSCPPSPAPRASAGQLCYEQLFYKIVWDDPRLRSLRELRRGRFASPQRRKPRRRGTPGTRFPGGHRRGVTPVPIPNTEVKPSTADGTAWVTAWESRSLPGLFLLRPDAKASGLFAVRRRGAPAGSRSQRVRGSRFPGSGQRGIHRPVNSRR